MGEGSSVTVRPTHAAMRDRALQLRVDDHVTLWNDHAAVVHGIRRCTGDVGVELLVAPDGMTSRWVDAWVCAQVLDGSSFLAERFAAAGKVCTACTDWHPLTSYYRARTGLFGRHSACMPCFRAAQRERDRVRRAARDAPVGGA